VGSGGGTIRRGEEVRKRCKRVNMVQILCTLIYKWENDLLKLFQEWEEGR
jgi:hypothetical protein